jgi:hypothetical protein
VGGGAALSGAPYLRDTFVADTTGMEEALGFRSRYGIRDALARHLGTRRGGQCRAA